jgi:hypothetical protein
MAGRQRVVREGVIAGLIGATAVAVWFLIVDSINGRPLYTPNRLGTALLDVFGPRGMEGMATHVVLYTIVHVFAFILVGMLVSLVVHRAEREPSILALFLVLFVVVELAFYGLTAILSDSGLLGDFAWYQVGVANLIAAFLMGTYMWRLHPALTANGNGRARERFAHEAPRTTRSVRGASSNVAVSG